MTEYDFSPEAYEKYLATQARIARWVDATQQTPLVAPDVPPTPLGAGDEVPLPRSKERKSRSRPSSPPPEKSRKSSGKKRSKSISARPPTPFEASQELPEPHETTADLPLPGCPVYRYLWSPKPENTPTLPPQPAHEYISGERRGFSAPASRHSPQDNAAPRELPQPARASYFPGFDSGNALVTERVKPSHPATRKRSMSFSAAASRPFDHSPPVTHHHSNGPHYSPPRDYSSHYSSRNSSPHYPSTSSAAFISPRPSAPAPRPAHNVGPHPLTKNLSYPLPYQQYPDYDAVRRHEISRSHTVPAHTMQQSVDSTPYVYSAPGYSHQRSRHQHHHTQSHSQPGSRPVSPGISAEPQPGSLRVTFPNGKVLYMTPPNADRSQILNHPELFQVPYEYYLPDSPKKKPFLQRLLPSFGRNNAKSSESKSARASPTPGKALRRRRSSFG